MALDSLYTGWLLFIETTVIVLYYSLGDKNSDLWTVIFHFIQNGTIAFMGLGWIFFGKLCRISKLFVGAIFVYNFILALFWWLDYANLVISPVPLYILCGLSFATWAAILIYQIILIRKNEISI